MLKPKRYNKKMRAPSFSLPDQTDKIHNLTDYQGKWLLLYFYPADDTPGCTAEACSFRDGRELLAEKGVEVIGVSKDSVKSHEKFVKKYDLNFTILADPSLETIKAYGAWGRKKMMGREFDGVLRNTYLISPSGEIAKTYEGVDPKTHIGDILKDLDTLLV